MFRSILVVSMAALTLLVPPGSAQPADELDNVLRNWEKATRDVKSVSCGLERQVIDKALQTKQTQKGLAMFLRAKGPEDLNRFRFELTGVNDPKLSQKFVGGGRFLYSYEPANKVVRVFELAPFKTAVLERISLLSFVFEMDAEQAKDRYQLELAGGDANYRYLRVRPKRERDKRDFTEARITLQRAAGLPAQIWYNQPNSSEITWNFSDMKIDSDQIEPRHFKPEIPNGWRLERLTSTR